MNLHCARRFYRRVDKGPGLRAGQTIPLRGPRTSKNYPDPLRRISCSDAYTRRRFVFLTNNFLLPALTTPQLHKCRWDVELFFKWTKQHLPIQAFYGISENAVKTQVWIAVSIYVLVAIVKKRLNIQRRLAEILQILRIAIFEKTPILQVLNTFPSELQNDAICNQFELFNF